VRKEAKRNARITATRQFKAFFMDKSPYSLFQFSPQSYKNSTAFFQIFSKNCGLGCGIMPILDALPKGVPDALC
jgi:hypothetical protein